MRRHKSTTDGPSCPIQPTPAFENRDILLKKKKKNNISKAHAFSTQQGQGRSRSRSPAETDQIIKLPRAHQACPYRRRRSCGCSFIAKHLVKGNDCSNEVRVHVDYHTRKKHGENDTAEHKSSEIEKLSQAIQYNTMQGKSSYPPVHSSVHPSLCPFFFPLQPAVKTTTQNHSRKKRYTVHLAEDNNNNRNNANNTNRLSHEPSQNPSSHYLAPGKLKPNPGTAGGVATATGSGLMICW